MRTNIIISLQFLLLISRISLTFQSSSSFALNSAKFHIFLNSNSHFYELIKRDSDNAILQDKSIKGNVDDTPGDVSSDSDNDDEDINVVRLGSLKDL